MTQTRAYLVIATSVQDHADPSPSHRKPESVMRCSNCLAAAAAEPLLNLLNMLSRNGNPLVHPST